MASGIPISALPASGPLLGNEVIPVVQLGETRFTTLNDVGGLLAGRASGSTSSNVKNYGAIGDGVHDDLAAFNAAVAAVIAQGGGTVFVPPGVYAISNTLIIEANDIYFEGCGAGFIGNNQATLRASAATRIVWAGSASPATGTAMFLFRTAAGQPGATGGGISRILVDGNAACCVGVKILTRRYMHFEDMTVFACTEDQYLTGAVDHAIGGGSITGTQWITFSKCVAGAQGTGGGFYFNNTAFGFHLTGGTTANPTANTSLVMFSHCHAYMAKGISYMFENCDNNFAYGSTGSAAFGVVGGYDLVLGSSDQDSGVGADIARYNHFFACTMKIICRASQTGGTSSVDNVFMEAVGANALAAPVFEAGAGGARDATGTVISGRGIELVANGSAVSTGLVSTMRDSTAGSYASMSLKKVSSAGANGMTLGRLSWLGTNSAGAPNKASGHIVANIADAIDANYTTNISIRPAVAASGGEVINAAQFQNGVTVPDGVTAIGYHGFGTINVAVGYYADDALVIDANAHFRLRSYTVATLPVNKTAGQMIYVSDGTANKRLAVADGTNWRFPDGAIVT